MNKEFLGRYDDISLEQYHNDCPGWSKSSLDLVHRSMAHYLANEKKKTEALIFGSAFHSSILTPDLYKKEFCIMPECDRRTTVGKQIYAQFQIENIGKEIITNEQSDSIKKMTESIFSHPIAKNLFNSGDAEHSFFWNDKETGLKCKCRPDYLRTDEICIELKSTKDASYDSFTKDVANYRYYVQGAYFKDGINNSGSGCKEFIICAVESAPPYNVALYRLDDEALIVGRAMYRADLQRVKKFFEVDENERWAGYVPVINDLYLPPWIK